MAPLHRTLDELATLATIRGDVVDSAAFAHASAIVRARHITSDADLGPLLDAPPDDADDETLRRLRYMYDAGAWVLLESAIADLPIDLRWLFESGAVTIPQLGTLHAALGVISAGDLAAEISRGAIRGIPGFDESVETAIADALPTLRASIPRVPLGRAVAAAELVLARLVDTPGVEWAVPAGSLRRGQELIGDIEIVAATTRAADALRSVAELPDIARYLHRGPDRIYVLMDRVQVGVRCVPAPQSGALLLQLTGSAPHLAALRSLAAERGARFTPAGLVLREGEPPIAASEADIYEALGLPYIAPEIRAGDEELEAARQGSLPTLVSRRDIRGDLHTHSEWSDGRDTIEAMVQGAVSLGYEYVAITDHSPHSAASRNLSIDGVAKQADEIAALRARYPQITILHGCEADIMDDGRLDFPDRVLERFDIVLASLHEGLGHSGDRLMRRYEAAMRHPLVTVITHPTNRVLPHRRGYDLDYDRLFALAAETRTVVEIDGAPAHLDLNGALARRAVRAGAVVAIDSDCHRVEMLGRQMQLGLLMARRGWVEARHVLNTRPLAEVTAMIAAKRRA